MVPGHSVTEEIVYFDPEDRLTWPDGGPWPQSSGGGFVEAAVAAYFTLRGYHVLQQFRTTSRTVSKRPVIRHSTELLYDVVGEEVSDFLRNELALDNPQDSGQPDLFIFREETPNDPKINYEDPRVWFFVEVKGPGDQVRDNQKAWWAALASRFGPERIRLARVVQSGDESEPAVVEY